jgi:putative SOS response-associated peptidase YedK
MCGRYSNDKNLDDLARNYQAAGGKGDDFMDWWKAGFSIAPTDPVPIVREYFDEGTIEREIEPAVWDLRPAWRKEIKAPQINARLETVAEKPMFKNAFTSRRAIVPMTGHFEWTGPKGDKQPHYIHAGGELLSAAGLYEVRKVEDEWEVSCLIITRTGEDSAGEVHDRMPVFLTSDVWSDWLNPDKLDASNKCDVLAMLDQSSQAVASTLSTYPVDRKVNSVRSLNREDPTLVEPITLD